MFDGLFLLAYLSVISRSSLGKDFLFYARTYPQSGDSSGASLGVRSVALLHIAVFVSVETGKNKRRCYSLFTPYILFILIP